jgi:antitoxin YefM
MTSATTHHELAIPIAMSVSEQMPLADVKNRLSEVVDRVQREHGRVIITRHGRPAAVVISVEDLESLEETIDIIDSAELLSDIRESLAELGTARRALTRLPEKVATAVVEFLYGSLADSPHRVGKQLKLGLEGLHSARCGDYRGSTASTTSAAWSPSSPSSTAPMSTGAGAGPGIPRPWLPHQGARSRSGRTPDYQAQGTPVQNTQY